MANDINITLPSGIEAPVSESIRKSKQYVLQRVQAEIQLASAIDAVLEKYVGLITKACYKYDIDPKDFTFGANEQLRQEVYALLDDLEEEILTLIEDYAVPNGRKNKHYRALIDWMLTLGTHRWNFQRTTEYYIYRFSQDLEAEIAAMRYAGVKQTAAITKMRSALHAPYSLPEMEAAIRSHEYFAADMIQTGGTKTDPFTHQPTVGLSKVGASNVTNMARSTLAMAWMRSLLLDAEDDKMAGYFVFRGSTYPCGLCDDLVGFHSISEGMVLPAHSHCCCYCVFVNSKDDEPTQYRPLNFR